MVIVPESSNKRTRTLVSNKMSAGGNSNGDNHCDGNSDYSDNESALRVGENYQARIPYFCFPKPAPSNYPEKADIVWRPKDDLKDSFFCDYLALAVDKYRYSVEQAMSLLFWHKYDIDCALADLPNFVPYPDEWTREDNALFEQAYQFHDKNFQKIHSLLPDKKISSLVKHYYNWKKNKNGGAHPEKQLRKNNQIKDDDQENGLDENDSDTEFENLNQQGNNQSHSSNRLECSNCHAIKQCNYSTKNGPFCESCFNLNYKNGSFHMDKEEPWSFRVLKYNLSEHTTKKIFSDKDVCQVVNSFNLINPAEMKKNLDNEIDVSIQTIQNLKQTIEEKRNELKEVGELVNIPPNPQKNISRWTSEEIGIFMQAIVEYGKDFKTIAEILGTKNENSVKLYFSQNYEKLKLSDIYKDHLENQFSYIKEEIND